MLEIGYENTNVLSAFTTQAMKNITSGNISAMRFLRGNERELVHVVGRATAAGGLLERKKALCHDCLAPLFHPIGENVYFGKPSHTIVIVEVTGIFNSFDAKLRVQGAFYLIDYNII